MRYRHRFSSGRNGHTRFSEPPTLERSPREVLERLLREAEHVTARKQTEALHNAHLGVFLVDYWDATEVQVEIQTELTRRRVKE